RGTRGENVPSTLGRQPARVKLFFIFLCMSDGLRGPPQYESRYLRPAQITQRMLPGHAAADVQHRRRFVKGPAIIAAAIAAGHEDRADQGEANLAAVNVAGEHQVDVMAPRPGNVI